MLQDHSKKVALGVVLWMWLVPQLALAAPTYARLLVPAAVLILYSFFFGVSHEASLLDLPRRPEANFLFL
jgi:hypothetical protein